MSKLRLGFIGAGGMADAHLKGLGNAELFPDIEIAAFCDVVLEKAEAQAAKYGARAFSSPKQMLAEAEIQACYVLLPPFAHGEAERACIEAGVPFLVEKPAGNNAGLLKELSAEVTKTGLLTAAGYMNRYQPSVEAAKAAFAAEPIVLALGGWWGGAPTMPANGNPSPILRWWVVKERSGGQMVEQVTHTVDLIRYFLGDAVEVFAHTTTAFNKSIPNLMPNYSIDDAMTTTVKFAGGALANIISSASTPRAGAVGSGIFLDIHGVSTSARFTGWGHDVKIAAEGKEIEEVKSNGDIFALEDRAFVDAVKSGDKSKVRTDYVDAVKTSLLTIGANVSAETGKPVDLTKF